MLFQDVGNVDDIARLVKQTHEQLGGLDIVIHNAGWTRFATFNDLNDLSHDEWNKVRALGKIETHQGEETRRRAKHG